MCVVKPNGSIHCPDMEFMAETPQDAARSEFESWLESYFGCRWCDEKVALALRLLRRLQETPINCERVKLRADKVVLSVFLHLEEEPASMQVFNYDTLPADSLGAWVHAINGFKELRDLHRKFDGRDPR